MARVNCENNSIIKKIQFLLNFLLKEKTMLVANIGLLGFLVLSLICELISGKSIFGFFGATCPIFFQAPSILEIIKILGFSTVLIGWVYSGLDKCILGLTRQEILNQKFGLYKLFSFFHISWTLACVATAVAYMSESALISIIGVLYGLLYQSWVFVNVVLDSEKCEKLAVNTWNEYFEKLNNQKENLMRLVCSFPKYDSSHYKKHQQCIAKILLIDNQPDFLRNLNEMWQMYLKANSSRDDMIVVEDLFFELCSVEYTEQEKDKREKKLCEIACGYLIFKINEIKNTASLEENEQTMLLLSQHITALVYNM